jgi:predicted DNA-binding transcriptional regulator AlpA
MEVNMDTPLALLTVGQFMQLQRKAETPTRSSQIQKYLQPEQLSELIGWKLTTVYQNHHKGLIPGACKVGNRLLFIRDIIEDWIDQGHKPTIAEKVNNLMNKSK